MLIICVFLSFSGRIDVWVASWVQNDYLLGGARFRRTTNACPWSVCNAIACSGSAKFDCDDCVCRGIEIVPVKPKASSKAVVSTTALITHNLRYVNNLVWWSCNRVLGIMCVSEINFRSDPYFWHNFCSSLLFLSTICILCVIVRLSYGFGVWVPVSLLWEYPCIVACVYASVHSGFKWPFCHWGDQWGSFKDDQSLSKTRSDQIK